MRRSSWLRAALPLSAALAILLILQGAPATLAQTRSLERTLFVSALDSRGAPVEGLGPDAFIVRENGARREILRVSRATEPIDITVMIDNSAAATDEMSFIRSALPKFVATLAPANPIALIGLAERPTILLPSTTDVKRLTTRAEGLFALPGTGMTLLMKRPGSRAAIVAIFTDGVEFTDRYAKEVVQALTKARASAHLLTIGKFMEDTSLPYRERVFFISQVGRTGGQQISMMAPHPLAANLERVAKELMSQYKVVYARPDALIPPDSVELVSGREGITMRGTPDRSQKGP
jgi:hypothetical protein